MTPAQVAAVETAVRALTARAEVLRPTVANLAREVYAVRWDLDEEVVAADMSEEVWDHLLCQVGFDDLAAVMLIGR